MPTIQEFYHRGNNDAAEGNRLTAVFELKLIVGTEACTEIEIDIPGFDFFFIAEEKRDFLLPDFAGDDAIAFVRDKALPRAAPPPAQRQAQKACRSRRRCTARNSRESPTAAVAGIKFCLGNVAVTVVVDIGSPTGAGNGEAQSGPIAARFGLEHNGAFLPFIGGALAPGSEHWHASQTVQVATIPCTGGASAGTLLINSGLVAPAAYEVSWDVVIASCGAITKSDIVLKPRVAPPGLGGGGLPDPPLKEGRDRRPASLSAQEGAARTGTGHRGPWRTTDPETVAAAASRMAAFMDLGDTFLASPADEPAAAAFRRSGDGARLPARRAGGARPRRSGR